MNQDCLKLTMYFGERDRAGGRFLAEALIDIFERHAVQTSALMRGVEGFGIKHRLQTAGRLSLSEDLPVVAVAVDTRERIQALLGEVQAVSGHGLITLERARMLTGSSKHVEPEEPPGEETKLTVYLGRQERVAGQPAYRAVVDLLHRREIAGATALLGVDGTVGGARRRAAFLGRNAEVPMMIIGVGDPARIRDLLGELTTMVERPLVTLERVRVCKRDGRHLASPRHVPERDDSGLVIWQKLMIHSGGQARHDGEPLSTALVRRLRSEQAAGATSLRAFWGYHGGHEPHGDRFWSLTRHAPLLTIVVDTPQNVRRWFEIVDEVTVQTGLVTSELVPAVRATGPQGRHGGLELARPAKVGLSVPREAG